MSEVSKVIVRNGETICIASDVTWTAAYGGKVDHVVLWREVRVRDWRWLWLRRRWVTEILGDFRQEPDEPEPEVRATPSELQRESQLRRCRDYGLITDAQYLELLRTPPSEGSES